MDVEFIEDVVFLEDKAELRVAVAIEIILTEVLRGFVLDDDFPAVGLVEAAHHVEQGRFAGSGLAENEDQSRFRESQRNMV